MLVTLSLITLLLLLVTLLPLWRHPHWITRGMDFPRLQFSVAGTILLLAQLIFLDLEAPKTWMLIAPTLLCLACQLWWIAPYTRLWPHEVKPAKESSTDRHPSILTANVLTPNRNAEALIALVQQRKPDILVTLESDQWWQDQFDTLQSEMPHSIKCPLDNLYGMHVYSRLPPIGSDHFPLFTELSYTPRHGATQEGLEADSADRSWARSKIEEQNVSQADVPRPGERSGFPSFGGCPDRVTGGDDHP